MSAASEERARRRAAWPVRVKRLADPEGDDLRATTTPEERLAMVWPLTLEAWRVAGLPMPGYDRRHAPSRLLGTAEHWAREDRA